MKKLISQIEEILPQLDKESLTFLKEQADVLLYNISVRKRNAEVSEAAAKKKKSGDVPEEKPVQSTGVQFEQLKNGKFFNLCIGDARIFMDHTEIRSLLKIALAANGDRDAAERLYNWFKRERKDVLVDGHIGGPGHGALPLIYRELLATFEVS